MIPKKFACGLFFTILLRMYISAADFQTFEKSCESYNVAIFFNCIKVAEQSFQVPMSNLP